MRSATQSKKLFRVRRTTPACLHRVLVGHDDGHGLCLECRIVVPTPFVIHRAAA